MRPTAAWLPLTLFLAASAACGSPGASNTGALATAVAATLTARASATPSPAASSTSPVPTPPASREGTVTGRVCYPGERIPAMTAYFQSAAGGVLVTLPIAQDQSTYIISLAPGDYVAYAWLPSFNLGGSFSNAVACGLSAACADHSLTRFRVAAGETTVGIDLCDWYGASGDVPLPPGAARATASPTPAVTPSPSPTSSTPGGITGSLSYPGGTTPATAVVAIGVSNTYWRWVGTGVGWASYALASVPPGTYHVIAYASNGQEAGYASGASLLTVTVLPGETTTGIDLTTWYPEGTFPPKPAGIDYP